MATDKQREEVIRKIAELLPSGDYHRMGNEAIAAYEANMPVGEDAILRAAMAMYEATPSHCEVKWDELRALGDETTLEWYLKHARISLQAIKMDK